MTDQLTGRLFDFIESSPTSLHTVNAVRAMLLNAGFTELSESGAWELSEGHGYFTTRSQSSITFMPSQWRLPTEIHPASR